MPSAPTRQFVRALVAPVVVGVVLRVAWIVIGADEPNVESCLCDPGVYLALAQNNIDGRWFTDWLGAPTSFLSVGYPALLAVVHHLTFGLASTWRAAMLVNLTASVALIAGAGVLARQVWATSGRIPVLAAWVMAVFPDAVIGTGLVMTELPATAGLMGCAILMLRWQRRQDSRRLAMATAALASFTVWLRPSWMFILPSIIVWMTVRWWRDHRAVAAGTMAAVVTATAATMLLLVAPLYWNNTVRVGAPAGITSATWHNICLGATGASSFVVRDDCEEPFEAGTVPPQGWEGRSAHLARARALEDIGGDPIRWVSAVPARLARAFALGGWGVEVTVDWSSGVPAGTATPLRTVSRVAFGLVALAAAVGALARRARWAGVGWVVGISTLAGVVVSFGQTRFGWPLTAVVFVPMAAQGFHIASLRVRSHRIRTHGTG